MVKEMAIYLERQQAEEPEAWRENLKVVFRAVFNQGIRDPAMRLFWLDIVCEGIESENCL